jgi:hypothetical protein
MRLVWQSSVPITDLALKAKVARCRIADRAATVRGRRASVQVRFARNRVMNHLAPHYVNEHQSDIRGIKDGWYAMEKDGNLVSGPFSSREDCLKLSNTRSEGTLADCNY